MILQTMARIESSKADLDLFQRDCPCRDICARPVVEPLPQADMQNMLLGRECL